MTISVFAPAKINLSLHVVGQRDDGYHLLDSLVAFAPVGDRLVISDYGVSSLTVEGPEAAGVPADMNNLVLRAAKIVAPLRPVSITLEKHLPTSSGIGGGSADAAAVVRGLVIEKLAEHNFERVAGLSDEEIRAVLSDEEIRPLFAPMFEKLISLGADIPMCCAPQPQRVRGIGGEFTFVTLPTLHAVLVNPRVSVSTPEVFAALEEKENAPMPEELPVFENAVEFCVWLSDQRNDLENPALLICPEIGQVLGALGALEGIILTRMSGSGATCFGIFDTREKAILAVKKMRHDYPHWWVNGGNIGDMLGKSIPVFS